jgi:hypothetical protein
MRKSGESACSSKLQCEKVDFLKKMNKPASYRITKYDPSQRDEWGAYIPQAWTSAADVGKQFPQGKLTLEIYLNVEKAYLNAALSLWKLAKCPRIQILGLEKAELSRAKLKHEPELVAVLDNGASPEEGQVLCEQTEIERVIKLVLREYIWCRLGSSKGFFLHFGWDYYMYCGGVQLNSQLRDEIMNSGLFVEDFDSPYLDSR